MFRLVCPIGFLSYLKWTLPLLTVVVVNGNVTGRTRVNIHIPSILRNTNDDEDFGYDHRPALFGFPPYDGSIVQQVIYAESDLRDPIVNKTKGVPLPGPPWPSPFILMVDHGACSFVTKVRHAQNAGAMALIIADNACQCSDPNCLSDSQICEASEPILTDDGSGHDISIPSVLLFKSDADNIKRYLYKRTNILMEISWSSKVIPGDRVECDLWFVPGDPISTNFLREFGPVAIALGDHAYFTPHAYVFDGTLFGCQQNEPDMSDYLCGNICRYCAISPAQLRGVTGKDVVHEALRLSCIWRKFGEIDGVGSIWWNYIKEFADRCQNQDDFMNPDCIKVVYENTGMTGSRVDVCMGDTGGLDKDQRNTILDMHIESQLTAGIYVTPTARVNGRRLQEELSVSNVFSAICNAFSSDDRPDVCRKCSNCLDITTCAENSGICPKHDDAISDSDCPDTSESLSTNGSYSDTRSSTTSTAIPNTY